jgi:hypothetical protein
MHSDRSQGRPDGCSHSEQRKEVTNQEEDAAIAFAVLALLLVHHPAQMIVAELKREIVEDPDSFAQVDAIERAVRDLAGAGLLHHGEFAIPTRAALCFDALANS